MATMVARSDLGPILGVLLAGGGSRRMGGGDKCLRELGGRTILARIVEQVAPQVDTLILNAGGDAARFAGYGLPVVADSLPGQAGPLAGVLTGLEWARENMPGCSWVASFACDAPFVPENLVDNLAAALAAEGADMARAASGGRAHPVFGLWPVRLAADLRRAVAEADIRKVDAWTAHYHMATVNFPVVEVDPFFNVNRPDDLAAAERFVTVV
jgi:molybdopterin-guanine dinucleotide biosynthesis protein A